MTLARYSRALRNLRRADGAISAAQMLTQSHGVRPRCALLFAAAGLVSLAGCSATTKAATTSTTQVLTSTPTTSTSGPATATTAAGAQLPITDSTPLSSDGLDPSSIISPTSCTLQNGTLTARGTFASGSESLGRSGDVVELYAYTAPVDGGQTYQVIDLASEHPFALGGGSGSWSVTGLVDTQVGVPADCFVAIQSTHAFMGAGSAGG